MVLINGQKYQTNIQIYLIYGDIMDNYLDFYGYYVYMAILEPQCH